MRDNSSADRTPVEAEYVNLAVQDQPIFAGIPGPATRAAEPSAKLTTEAASSSASSPAVTALPASVAVAAEPVLPLIDSATFVAAEAAIVPRKRGRPRKVVVEAAVES